MKKPKLHYRYDSGFGVYADYDDKTRSSYARIRRLLRNPNISSVTIKYTSGLEGTWTRAEDLS